MGRITIDNLSASLKTYMQTLGLTEEQVIEVVNRALAENSTEELQTDNKTIVGAINELFQNVDSGKQLIADTIDDENITKDSSFSAMSEAIANNKTQLNNANSQVTTLTTQVNNANSEINTAKSSLAKSLSNKGVSATASETLSSLTGKVSKLFTVSLVAGNSTTVLSYTSGDSSFSSALQTMLEIPVSTILNSKTHTTWTSFRVNADIYTTAASASSPKYLNVKVLLTNSAGTVKASSSEWSNLYTQSGEHHTTGSIDFSNAVAGDIVKIQSRCYYNSSSGRAYIKSVTITVDSVVK